MGDDFLGGVVEGFYGQPWSHDQRLALFGQMADWDLNTYFYAPKDDLKHRARWRDLYNESELELMAELVAGCDDHGLRFIYGLSPGLDMAYANMEDFQKIQQRFQQMRQVGARHFALLFDDLPGELGQAERDIFSSVAAAHCQVTNNIFRWLQRDYAEARLLFCPTPYCDRMDRCKLGGAGYLDTIGQELDKAIDVLWTGPEIISEEILVDSITRLSQRIGRPPIIWDNLHANDYDLRRLYCGPYSRSTDLRFHVRGILANPNNEYLINYIPLQTLGEYIHKSDYEPRAAYLMAIRDWTEHFATLRGQVAYEDLLLLADCYYLPHAEGEEAERLQQSIESLLTSPIDTWGQTYDEFIRDHQRIERVFDQLTQLANRGLFYAWSRRVWELREELDLIKDFADSKRNGQLQDGAFVSENHLPKCYRGGMVARLQRKLIMHHDGRFQPR